MAQPGLGTKYEAFSFFTRIPSITHKESKCSIHNGNQKNVYHTRAKSFLALHVIHPNNVNVGVAPGSRAVYDRRWPGDFCRKNGALVLKIARPLLLSLQRDRQVQWRW
jgi:hypothetical protein